MSKKIICTNKKAYHDYTIEATMETGIVLTGPEVKSLRAGRANLRDGYAAVEKDEVWLHNVHISPYSHATNIESDPLRTRKLLLNRREIRKLAGKVREKGFALIPTKMYFIASGKVKVELALARGKKQYDKRADLKRKQSDREIEREYKSR
ncbi:MAG: SsrA-binding protein SmpB [Deltaproteobacteria bacterium]|nr:SsrA-binding protein SmpB [Deltaproteobacteria bacterium]